MRQGIRWLLSLVGLFRLSATKFVAGSKRNVPENDRNLLLNILTPETDVLFLRLIPLTLCLYLKNSTGSYKFVAEFGEGEEINLFSYRHYINSTVN